MSSSPAVRRRPRRSALVAWAVVAADIAGLGAVALGVLPEPPDTPPGGTWIFLLLAVAFGVVAARVVTAQPGNRLGWVMWLQPTLLAVSGPGASYAVISVDRYGGSLPFTAGLAWASGLALLPFITITLLVVPLIFPDGRLPSARWRPAAWNAVLATALVLVGGAMFLPGPLTGFPDLQNPVGIAAGQVISAVTGPLGALLIFIGLPLGAAAVVTRFRRGGPAGRQQVKWFGAGVAVPALLLVASLVLQTVTALWVLSIAALGLIPVAIGIAILRYRLFEIDRMVSRTIGWAIVTGLLLMVFAVLVVTLEAVLAPVTNESTPAVAASTLVAFALFQPVRRRVQRAVDRRFDRAAYDGQKTIDLFGERLRNEVDLTSLRASLAFTATEAVQPTRASVWLRSVQTASPTQIS